MQLGADFSGTITGGVVSLVAPPSAFNDRFRCVCHAVSVLLFCGEWKNMLNISQLVPETDILPSKSVFLGFWVEMAEQFDYNIQ